MTMLKVGLIATIPSIASIVTPIAIVDHLKRPALDDFQNAPDAAARRDPADQHLRVHHT
jgi:hypothetical protein